jgi:hypothetical protein
LYILNAQRAKYIYSVKMDDSEVPRVLIRAVKLAVIKDPAPGDHQG